MMTGRSYRIRMLGDGIIVLPDEVLENSGLKRDDEVEFYIGDGQIEMRRVKPLRPFTLAHPLLQVIGRDETACSGTVSIPRTESSGGRER